MGFVARIRAAAAAAVTTARRVVKEATRPLPLLTGLVADLTRSRKELLAENALLRQLSLPKTYPVANHAASRT
jgi:hypothetical protein